MPGFLEHNYLLHDLLGLRIVGKELLIYAFDSTNTLSQFMYRQIYFTKRPLAKNFTNSVKINGCVWRNCRVLPKAEIY